MELNDLKVFVAVADEGSLTKAAGRLGYVQSNVTARVRKLEDEFRAQLFYRTPSGVRLTEEGCVILGYARSILDMADEMSCALHNRGELTGSLRLGVVEHVTCGKFIEIIEKFQAAHRRLHISIETGASETLVERVRNYDLDAAIATDVLEDEELAVDVSFTNELAVVSSSEIDWGLLEEQNLSVEQDLLAEQRWVVFPHKCPFRSRLSEWLQGQGSSLHDFLEVNSLETMLSSVRAGLAIAVLPRTALSGPYSGLHAYPLPAPYRTIEDGLVRRKGRYEQAQYIRFREMLIETGL